MEYKAVVEGKGGIVARIVADSVSANGKRITTFEGEVHRSIWSEFMTHRLFSRNAMSSRAVPVSKMIENTKAVPIKFGAKKAGMAAGEEHNDRVTLTRPTIMGGLTPILEYMPYSYTKEEAWEKWAESNREFAKAFDEAGYHKGDINRPLEAFQMMKFVMTTTELDNFFWLRRDECAKEEIREIADCMYKALQESVPQVLLPGQWHVPYVKTEISGESDRILGYTPLIKYFDDKDNEISLEEALAISSSCSAQISYRSIDNSYDKAMSIYGKLGVGSSTLHASPFEHQASPMKKGGSKDECPDYWEEGVTHMDRNYDLWSGNFLGWIQHRQLLSNHTCWNYNE